MVIYFTSKLIIKLKKNVDHVITTFADVSQIRGQDW